MKELFAENKPTPEVKTVQNKDPKTKESLCSLLSTLQSQVNELALSLCVAEGPELHEVWLNLANARAFLTTALETARNLKEKDINLKK